MIGKPGSPHHEHKQVTQAPTRSQPSTEGFVFDLVDFKQHAVDFVHHMDDLDEKENIGELHPSFAEDRHESSNSRPVISDAKHQPVHPCQSIKLESKSNINTVKKEDEMGEYWKNIKLYCRVPDIIPPTEDPNDNINRSFANKMPDTVSQKVISASQWRNRFRHCRMEYPLPAAPLSCQTTTISVQRRRKGSDKISGTHVKERGRAVAKRKL
jgi:hypothetical protein